MPVVGTIKMTADQFLQLAEDPVGVRLELVEGRIAVLPSQVPEHSYVRSLLVVSLYPHILAHDLGRLYTDVDTLFGPHDVRRPDLMFFSKARLHLVGRKAMEGPPDLCVEIISPSSEVIDRIDKFAQYEAAGVAHYWIVDPAGRTAEAFVLRADGKYVAAGRGHDQEVVHFPPFEELAIPLGQLWHVPVDR